MTKLEGKVTVSTSGSSSIGLATVKLFVAQRAHGYITGRRQSELDTAVSSPGSNCSSMEGQSKSK